MGSRRSSAMILQPQFTRRMGQAKKGHTAGITETGTVETLGHAGSRHRQRKISLLQLRPHGQPRWTLGGRKRRRWWLWHDRDGEVVGRGRPEPVIVIGIVLGDSAGTEDGMSWTHLIGVGGVLDMKILKGGDGHWSTIHRSDGGESESYEGTGNAPLNGHSAASDMNADRQGTVG